MIYLCKSVLLIFHHRGDVEDQILCINIVVIYLLPFVLLVPNQFENLLSLKKSQNYMLIPLVFSISYYSFH